MGNTIEIIQGSTPTLELSLPTSIDLSETNIYFSIEQFDKKFEGQRIMGACDRGLSEREWLVGSERYFNSFQSIS